MDEREARKRLAEYLRELRGDVGYELPQQWVSGTPAFRRLDGGTWLATVPSAPNSGVVLRSGGKCVPFFGALGQMVEKMGMPVTREYFLGSTYYGRYQAYAEGLAIWEAFPGGGDLGYPIARWEAYEQRARECFGLIAFFDLRGFTSWSSGKDLQAVQAVIEQLEIAFQDAFSRRWCQQIFAKGTGDGFMVVSEAEWYRGSVERGGGRFRKGHVIAFSRACAETVRNARGRIPKELAVGCGITMGPLTSVYLLGRFDYLGTALNRASKMQNVAYDELCIDLEVIAELEGEGAEVSGVSIPTHLALRVSADSLLE